MVILLDLVGTTNLHNVDGWNSRHGDIALKICSRRWPADSFVRVGPLKTTMLEPVCQKLWGLPRGGVLLRNYFNGLTLADLPAAAFLHCLATDAIIQGEARDDLLKWLLDIADAPEVRDILIGLRYA